MSDSSSDRRGRWVYQNLRWHYLPDSDAPASGGKGPELPPPALSSLVDTRRLIDGVAAWSAVTELSARVYAVDEGEHLRLLHPRDATTIEAVQAVAQRCAAEDRLLATAEASEAELLAIPVRLEWQGRCAVRMVVVAPVPATTRRRQAVCDQLIGVVDGYSAWVAQVLGQREELARLRRRNQGLMVRVESVEKRLVESCSEPLVRLDEGGTVLEDRILSQILDLPNLGVVVERREDHRILYMNANLRRRYGDRVGDKCFNVFRAAREPCEAAGCPMEVLFADAAPSMTRRLAYDQENGLHYEVFAVPLIGRDGSQQVLEIGVDVTRLIQREAASEEARARAAASEPAK